MIPSLEGIRITVPSERGDLFTISVHLDRRRVSSGKLDLVSRLEVHSEYIPLTFHVHHTKLVGMTRELGKEEFVSTITKIPVIRRGVRRDVADDTSRSGLFDPYLSSDIFTPIRERITEFIRLVVFPIRTVLRPGTGIPYDDQLHR